MLSKEFLLLLFHIFVVIASVESRYDVGNGHAFFPGKGCGMSNPIKYSEKVPENEEDRPCTKITDQKAYDEFMEKNVASEFQFLI